MRGMLTSIGEAIGIACVAVGAFMAWPPAGWIAAGCGIFAVSFAQGDDS